jgi:hypothetical protein
VLFGLMLGALVALAFWVIHSFRRWPSTDNERHSFIWTRRGGGDL